MRSVCQTITAFFTWMIQVQLAKCERCGYSTRSGVLCNMCNAEAVTAATNAEAVTAATNAEAVTDP
jgi:hypothetical protein